MFQEVIYQQAEDSKPGLQGSRGPSFLPAGPACAATPSGQAAAGIWAQHPLPPLPVTPFLPHPYLGAPIHETPNSASHTEALVHFNRITGQTEKE